MAVPTFFRRNPGCSRLIFWTVVVIVLAVAFSAEVRFFLQLLIGIPAFLTGGDASGLPPPDVILWTLVYLGVFCLMMLVFDRLLRRMVFGAALPGRTGADRSRTKSLFKEYTSTRRTALYVVREGQLVKAPDPRRQARHGVALVDQTSAIVLEKQWAVHPGLAGDRETGEAAAARKYPLSRVGRPGLVFINRHERMRGVVSLRKQTRMNHDVLAQTKDGIEVKADILTIFTLGQPPAVITVAYDGDRIPENLRVLHIDPSSRRIKVIADDLEADDKTEIDRFAQEYLAYNEPNVPLEQDGNIREEPPYHIDDERVMAAVFSQGRDVREGKVDDWTDLPAVVATGLFRNLISQETYDSLYKPEERGRLPLASDFKPYFGTRMRHLGVLAYQFVHRNDEQPPQVNQRVVHKEFRVSAVRELTASKLLRDRGIKVIVATFSELFPTNPNIPLQRLDNWKAQWESQADEIRADLDLEALRIRNRARAEKERELINQLMQIVQNSEHSEEALTLLVLQTLEEFYKDPYTQRLVPSETFNTLRDLRLWLLPDDRVPPAFLLDARFTAPRTETGEQEKPGEA